MPRQARVALGGAIQRTNKHVNSRQANFHNEYEQSSQLYHMVYIEQ